MEDKILSEPEFLRTENTDGCGAPSAQYTLGLFSSSKDFFVSGGQFTNVTHIHNAASSDRPDFQIIPLGDLNLINELGPGSASGFVRHRPGRPSVRKMYTARIAGSQTNMTVAMYQAAGAELWQAEISRYMDLRHPNIFQLYGVVSTGSLHATVFHDGGSVSLSYPTNLIPRRVDTMADSGESVSQLTLLCNVLLDNDGSAISGCQSIYIVSLWEHIVWIRSSTARLSLELTPPESRVVGLPFSANSVQRVGTSLLDSSDPWKIVTSISLQKYHSLCRTYLSRYQEFSIPLDISVVLASIRHFPGSEFESSIEVASVPDCGVDDWGWSTEHPGIEDYWIRIKDDDEGTLTLENGWICVSSANVVDEYRLRIHSRDSCELGWLAQATHMFNLLDVTSGFQQYVFLEEIRYRLHLCGTMENLPPAYLFLCPLAEFETEVPGYFQIPHYAAYWSLHPSGAQRLSTEEAKARGFPDFEVGAEVRCFSWDSDVYTGIRKFHEAKGFDPHSQDIAREAGYPLFHLSCDRETALAHLTVNDTASFDSDSDGGFENEDSADLYDGSSVSVKAAEDVDIVSNLSVARKETTDVDNVHAETNPSLSSAVRCYGPVDEAEMLTPSKTLDIVVWVQFALILIVVVTSLY